MGHEFLKSQIGVGHEKFKENTGWVIIISSAKKGVGHVYLKENQGWATQN